MINRNMKVNLIDNITRQMQIKAKTSIASNYNLARKSHILLYMLSTNHRLTNGPRPDVHGEPAPSCSSSTRAKAKSPELGRTVQTMCYRPRHCYFAKSLLLSIKDHCLVIFSIILRIAIVLKVEFSKRALNLEKERSQSSLLDWLLGCFVACLSIN